MDLNAKLTVDALLKSTNAQRSHVKRNALAAMFLAFAKALDADEATRKELAEQFRDGAMRALDKSAPE